MQKTSFSVWGPFVLTLLYDQKDLGLGGQIQACSHTCRQSIWKWCVWTHKYKTGPGSWHPWLLLKQHLSQNLSRTCRWEIAQPHRRIKSSFLSFAFVLCSRSLSWKRTENGDQKCCSFTLFPEYFLACSSRSLQRNTPFFHLPNSAI